MEHRGNKKRNQKGVRNEITNHVTLTLTGFGAAPVPSLNGAIPRVLDRLYASIPLPDKPITLKHVAKAERNAEIRARHTAGESIADLAREYHISDQRVFQILHHHLK